LRLLAVMIGATLADKSSSESRSPAATSGSESSFEDATPSCDGISAAEAGDAEEDEDEDDEDDEDDSSKSGSTSTIRTGESDLAPASALAEAMYFVRNSADLTEANSRTTSGANGQIPACRQPASTMSF